MVDQMNGVEQASERPMGVIDVNDYVAALRQEYDATVSGLTAKVAELRCQLLDKDRQIHGMNRMMEILRAENESLAGVTRADHANYSETDSVPA